MLYFPFAPRFQLHWYFAPKFAREFKVMESFTVPLLLLLLYTTPAVHGEKPAVVNVGAVLTFDSVIGKVAKSAIELAVSDVNKDPGILNGTELNLIIEDDNCSVFMASVQAFQLYEKEVVAIIGPESSVIAHMVSQIANGVKIPLISYAATDPTLSALQFPFFFRTTPSDSYQMEAMAGLVGFYGWKEVIAVYVDDDFGRNGVTALEDEVKKNGDKISYKLALPSKYELDDIIDVLNKSIPLGPRVYIIHVNPDPELRIFHAVKLLNMTTSDYVWLTTDWLCTTLASFSPVTQPSFEILQGVVGLCQHTPHAPQEKAFQTRWTNLQQKGLVNAGLNAYGLYAYDTVWTVAYAIDNFLRMGTNLTFSFSNAQIGELRVFDGGNSFVKILSETNFTGLTGHVHFDADRNLVPRGYDVINIVQMEIHRVGYWSGSRGLSVLPPEAQKADKNSSSGLDQKLGEITWPGGKTERPRGWVIGDDERPLRIGIPKRASFVEFVTELSNHTILGYCIDVFEEAKKLVPYALPSRYVAFGDGRANPSYDQLVKMVADDDFDGAVGDIAIVTNRTNIVDFTQPFATTGLVIVAPINNARSSAWVFLKPFTVEMWSVTAAAFVIIAIVIWILEHRVNDDFRGPLKRQLVIIFLFSFSTLFKKNQENTVSALGRMVMVVWLFLLMVVTSSYTASLTSILTVEQLSSPITGIDSLVATNFPIGYQVGSFAYTYLAESLYVPRSRLVALGTPDEYERALRLGPNKNGGVAAIVDELPYVELFLSKHTDFGIIGQSFTRSGWGFAFKRDSPLATAISTAILKLAENGKLQKIHDNWFCKMGCSARVIQDSEPNQLQMSSFWGLYLASGALSLTALVVFLLQTVSQYIRYKQKQAASSSPSFSSSSPTSRGLRVIFNFLDFVDEKEEAIIKMFRSDNSQQCKLKHKGGVAGAGERKMPVFHMSDRGGHKKFQCGPKLYFLTDLDQSRPFIH